MVLQRTVWLCLFLLLTTSLFAQNPLPRPSQSSDTVRRVDIINANRFDFKTIDSTTQLQILTGKVQIRQGVTLFTADSVVYNERTNFMEAFGNVHINDADSVNIYSQYLQYEGTKKMAVFKNKVKLSDGNSTLFTDEMEYDMNAKVGNYKNGGRIESKQTTLYSKQGFYYADIKDVYFIGAVKMSDPEVALASDSLLYNTGNQVATFIAPTTIKTGNSIINTKEGYYDLKLKKAKFGKRARMQDSTSVMVADDFAFDDKTGYGEAKGNIQYKDTAQGFLLFSNRAFFNREKKNFLATEKPVMVIVKDNDSVYVAADTIFSGLMRDLPGFRQGYIHAFDTTNQKQAVAASVPVNKKDSLKIIIKEPLRTETDSSAAIITTDSVQTKIRPQSETDTLRFITAFRHVRIYNDSLQAVADSVFYSGVDSVFQMYYDPIAWSKGSQVTGDTIFVYTKNRKPERLYVFENAMMIQNVSATNEFFNQVRGRTINGYFVDGEIDYVRAKGTSESIYYAIDNDSAYVGMNRTTADMIDLHFNKRTVKKVKFTRSVKGTTYPIRKLPEDQKKLTGFQWLEDKRPKSKLELFL